MKENLVRDKSFEFALMAIQLYKALREGKEFELSRQFIRSSTSIGANVEEALAGYGKKDFAAKMNIISKPELSFIANESEKSNFSDLCEVFRSGRWALRFIHSTIVQRGIHECCAIGIAPKRSKNARTQETSTPQAWFKQP